MSKCRLSVVIPCYNYGVYLSETINSVLNQNSSMKNFEIIVVNDYSNDKNTLEILSQWKNKDNKLRIISNTGRKGVSAARNFGIKEARGEWIAFLDADDIWLPDSLQLRWNVIESFPDAQWIGGDFIKLYADGVYDETGFFYRSNKVNQILEKKASRAGITKRLLKPIHEFLQVSLGWTGTIFVKKVLLDKVGGFDENLEQYEDHHLWFRLAKEADFYFVSEVVAIYRQHYDSLSHIERPPVQWYAVALELLLQDIEFRAYEKELRSKLGECYAQNAYYHRERGERKLACIAAMKSLKNTPFKMLYWRNFIGALIGKK